MLSPRIIYEDNHLLVVDKPPGWAVMGAADDAPQLTDWAKADLKQRYNKPGNVFIGVVSRLDTFVSGVIVLAKTSKAAARLNEQFAGRTARKRYWAIVPTRIKQPTGEWRDWLLKDDAARRIRTVHAGTSGAQEALLRYRVLAAGEDWSGLEIELLTGRKHQIRVQCAAHAAPIWGDQKYGSDHRFAPRTIALHSRSLTVRHPTRDEEMTWLAEPPPAWSRWLPQLIAGECYT